MATPRCYKRFDRVAPGTVRPTSIRRRKTALKMFVNHITRGMRGFQRFSNVSNENPTWRAYSPSPTSISVLKINRKRVFLRVLRSMRNVRTISHAACWVFMRFYSRWQRRFGFHRLSSQNAHGKQGFQAYSTLSARATVGFHSFPCRCNCKLRRHAVVFKVAIAQNDGTLFFCKRHMQIATACRVFFARE